MTYTPAPNGNGNARSTFKFAVDDADPGTFTATMSINVTPINDISSFGSSVSSMHGFYL